MRPTPLLSRHPVAILVATAAAVLFVWVLGPQLLTAFKAHGLIGGSIFGLLLLVSYLVGLVAAVVVVFMLVLMTIRFLLFSFLGWMVVLGLIAMNHEKSRDFTHLGVSEEFAVACFKVEACRSDLYAADKQWRAEYKKLSPTREKVLP